MNTKHESSTQSVPEVGAVPRHVAIIMDGNGRWAKRRYLPRIAGHRRGLEVVRETVKGCMELGIEHLTVFAFSSENWRRPAEEVRLLTQLFATALEQEVERLHGNGVRLRVVGDLERFGPTIGRLVREAEEKTAANPRFTLTIAANYGGRWDILQAVNRLHAEQPGRTAPVTEEELASRLCMSYAPEPDLFIRTGGEQRISNFLLWSLAYTELYFTDTLWPDFDRKALRAAVDWYGLRERRFGRTSEQVAGAGPLAGAGAG